MLAKKQIVNLFLLVSWLILGAILILIIIFFGVALLGIPFLLNSLLDISPSISFIVVFIVTIHAVLIMVFFGVLVGLTIFFRLSKFSFDEDELGDS